MSELKNVSAHLEQITEERARLQDEGRKLDLKLRGILQQIVDGQATSGDRLRDLVLTNLYDGDPAMQARIYDLLHELERLLKQHAGEYILQVDSREESAIRHIMPGGGSDFKYTVHSLKLGVIAGEQIVVDGRNLKLPTDGYVWGEMRNEMRTEQKPGGIRLFGDYSNFLGRLLSWANTEETPREQTMKEVFGLSIGDVAVYGQFLRFVPLKPESGYRLLQFARTLPQRDPATAPLALPHLDEARQNLRDEVRQLKREWLECVDKISRSEDRAASQQLRTLRSKLPLLQARAEILNLNDDPELESLRTMIGRLSSRQLL